MPGKGRFRGWRKAGTSGELLFTPSNRRNTAQRLMVPNLIAVRLFFIGNDYGCTEQAVSDAVAFSCPSHTVIDDVGVDGAVLPNLPNLDPAIFHQNRERALNGPA